MRCSANKGLKKWRKAQGQRLWKRRLSHYFSNCGPRMVFLRITWELFQDAESWAIPDLPVSISTSGGWDSSFLKTPMWLFFCIWKMRTTNLKVLNKIMEWGKNRQNLEKRFFKIKIGRKDGREGGSEGGIDRDKNMAYTGVSQPHHYWYLRPDNSLLLGSVLWKCRVFSSSPGPLIPRCQ